MIKVGYEIDDADWAMFYAKFSAKVPMNMLLGDDGKPIPEYKTELEHVEAEIERHLARIEKHGKDILKLKVASAYDAKIINKE